MFISVYFIFNDFLAMSIYLVTSKWSKDHFITDVLTSKRQVINLRNCCIWLVDLYEIFERISLSLVKWIFANPRGLHWVAKSLQFTDL